MTTTVNHDLIATNIIAVDQVAVLVIVIIDIIITIIDPIRIKRNESRKKSQKRTKAR